MMKKLIMLGMSMTIGLLGNILFNSCGNPLAWTPPQEYIQHEFKNNSKKTIELIFNKSLPQEQDKIVVKRLLPNESYNDFKFVLEERYKKNYQKAGVTFFAQNGGSIELRELDNSTKNKIWKGPGGAFDKKKNSPFNYNSWDFKEIQNSRNGIVGVLTFTITDEDLT